MIRVTLAHCPIKPTPMEIHQQLQQPGAIGSIMTIFPGFLVNGFRGSYFNHATRLASSHFMHAARVLAQAMITPGPISKTQ